VKRGIFLWKFGLSSILTISRTFLCKTAKWAQHTIPTICNIPSEFRFYTILWYTNHTHALIARTSHFLEPFHIFCVTASISAWQVLSQCCSNVSYNHIDRRWGRIPPPFENTDDRLASNQICAVGRENLYLCESRIQLESCQANWTLISSGAIHPMGSKLTATRFLIHWHSGRFVADLWYLKFRSYCEQQ